MSDTDRTRDQLAAELAELRQQFAKQNHRLSLQAAVERIRAEAASMQQSGDLGKVMLALWNGLAEAIPNFDRGSLNIVDMEAGTWQCFLMLPIPEEMLDYYNSTPYLYQADVAPGVHLMRSELLPLEFSQEHGHANPYTEPSFWVAPEDFPAQLEQMWGGPVPGAEELIGCHGINIPFAHGGIWTMATKGTMFDPSDLDTAMQFSDAMSLGYTRFLDLQAAEERSRQMAIERSVERVRAATLAMRRREDFLDVAAVLAREIGELEFESPGCNITFIDEESGYGADYVALRNPRQYGASWSNPAIIEVDEDFIVFVREATVSTVFGAEEFTVPGWRESGSRTEEIPYQMVQKFFGDLLGIELPPELYGTGTGIGTAVYFPHGKVGFNESEYHEEHVAIMKQLVDALALGVVRFLDFQKVEQAQQKLIDEMEEELQTAHEMQMNLMPTESPQIEGLDIAGRCLTANHVGGDFFQYFPRNGKLSLTLADVTGHAMEAAIPAVMFSGILDNQMEIGGSLEELFDRLNRSMHRNLDDRTFVCFTAAELDLQAHTARLANGGCPYPYHYRAATNDVVELQVEAYPLGVQATSNYPVIEVQVSPGDRLVLCSDGIVEAADPDDELFGFDRTAAAVQEGGRKNLSSESLIEFIFTRLAEFTGDAPRGDDQTVVALRCIDEGQTSR
jgi:serine phosphatase RsbU (regulator of sigma subunit)